MKSVIARRLVLIPVLAAGLILLPLRMDAPGQLQVAQAASLTGTSTVGQQISAVGQIVAGGVLVGVGIASVVTGWGAIGMLTGVGQIVAGMTVLSAGVVMGDTGQSTSASSVNQGCVGSTGPCGTCGGP